MLSMLSTPGASLAVGKGPDGEGLPHIRRALRPPHRLHSYTAGSLTQSTAHVCTRNDAVGPLPSMGRDYRKESKRIVMYCSCSQGREGRGRRGSWGRRQWPGGQRSRGQRSVPTRWGRGQRNPCELHGGPLRPLLGNGYTETSISGLSWQRKRLLIPGPPGAQRKQHQLTSGVNMAGLPGSFSWGRTESEPLALRPGGSQLPVLSLLSSAPFLSSP